MHETKKSLSSSKSKDLKILKFLLFSIFLTIPFAAATEYLWPISIIIFLQSLIVLYFFFGLLKYRKVELLNTLTIPLVLIFFAIALFTLLPIPRILLKAVSPNSFAIYKDYLPSFEAGGFLSSFRTLSLAPYRTLLSVSLLFCWAAIFFSLINRFDTFRLRTRLANLIVAIGTVIAGWGLLDLTIKNEKLFWIREIISGSPTGPFINSIHFAHFLALCIPLSLGMWIGNIDFTIDRGDFSKLKTLLRNITGFVKASFLYLVPALIMILAVFKALSRGAMLSLIVSTIVFTVLILAKKKTRPNVLFFVLIIILGIVAVFSLDTGDIKERVATLREPFKTDSAVTRMSVWEDTFKISRDFPLFGTGLNTFQVIFNKYKNIFGSGKMLFTHAENDYIETLSEVGVLGAICVIAALLIFLRNVYYNFKWQEEEPFKIALLAGGISCLVAVLVSASTDFVFHIPAISLVFLLICFIVWPQAGRKKTITLDFRNNPKKFFLAGGALLFLSLFFLILSIKLFCGQLYFYKFIHAPNDSHLKTGYLEQACLLDRSNPEYRYRLGKLYLDRARPITKGESASLKKDFKKAKENFNIAINLEPTNWRYHFYAGAAELGLAAEDSGGSSISKAQALFDQALELNPTEYEIYNYLGEHYLVMQPSKAFGYYKKLLELRPWRMQEVLNNIWKVTDNPNFIRKAIPDDPKLLVRYAGFLKSKGARGEAFYLEAIIFAEKVGVEDRMDIAREFLAARRYKEAMEWLIKALESTPRFKNNKDDFLIREQSAKELLLDAETIESYTNIDLKSSKSLYKLALFYYQLNDYNKSLKFFKKLIEMQPQKVEWKFKYGLTLSKAGKYGEACKVLEETYNSIINPKH